MKIIRMLKERLKSLRPRAISSKPTQQETHTIAHVYIPSEEASSILTNHSKHMKKADNLRYPIGPFEYGKTYSLAQTRENIHTIERLPNELRKVLRKIGRSYFDASYRPGGWTVRQVVHHLADAHMNAFIRMKMALTEPTPVIKPYEQDLWAKTADVMEMPIKVSLRLLIALHRRWVALLESLTEDDLEKGYFHPERNAIVFLPEAIALYAWHCKHHLAHLNIVAHNIAASKSEKYLMTGMKSTPTVRESRREETSPIGRAEALARARAARAARRAERGLSTAASEEEKSAASAERPKLTRAEALARARAARAAKRAERGLSTAASEEEKSAASAERPKLTRAEALARARAARAAKRNEGK